MLPDPSVCVWIGIGLNLGDRAERLAAARKAVIDLGSGPALVSPVVESAAWGETEQPDFLNQIIGLVLDASPLPTLLALQTIEHRFGRKREQKWGPRTLDLDLLCWPGQRSDDPQLTLPHPHLAHRRFVLAPWARIAPALVVPGLGRTVAQLLAACTDPLSVRFLD